MNERRVERPADRPEGGRDDRAAKIRAPIGVHVAFGSFVLCAVLALVWPGPAWFGEATPRVLGLPFSLAWIVGWVVAMFGAMLAYDRAVHGRRS